MAINSSMKLIIEKVRSAYSDNDSLNEIIKDLKSDDCLDYWANNFCSDEYGCRKDLAKSIYEYMEQSAESSSDYCWVARAVCNSLDDQDWAKILFSKAEKTADDDLSNLTKLAKSLADSLKDRDWARKVFKAAEQRTEDPYGFVLLAESILSDAYLGDQDWAKLLFSKAEESAGDFDDFRDVARPIAASLGDKDWARKIFKAAEQRAEEPKQWLDLAQVI